MKILSILKMNQYSFSSLIIPEGIQVRIVKSKMPPNNGVCEFLIESDWLVFTSRDQSIGKYCIAPCMY